MPPIPVLAPPYGSIADGWLWLSMCRAYAWSSSNSTTPASPRSITYGAWTGKMNSLRTTFEDLYQQCSDHAWPRLCSSMSVGSLPIRRKCSWMRRISSTLSASPILSLSCASCGAEASPRTTSYRGNGADRRTNRSSIPVPPERTNGGATLCFSYGRERRAEWKLQVARCAHAGAMRRPFRASLASTPLVLEIVPPSRRASEKAVSNLADRVRDAVGSSGRLAGRNLPQVLEET